MKLYVKIALSALLLMAMWCAMIMMQTYPALSQPITPPGVVWVTSAPTGSCGYGPIYITQSTGAITACINGTYGSVGGGGALAVSCSISSATTPVSATDLAIDASNNTKISSATYTFTSPDVDRVVVVTSGTGFTAGAYIVQSVSGGAATVDRAVGTVGSTGGSFNLPSQQACTHNLGTKNVTAPCYDANGAQLGSSGTTVSEYGIYGATTSIATIAFSAQPPSGTSCLISTGSNMGPQGATGTPGSNGASYGGTSTTSLTIGSGSQSLTTQTGLAWQAGNTIELYSDASHYMDGTVSSYNSATGSLVATITTAVGGGTLASWTLGPARGPAASSNVLHYTGSPNASTSSSTITILKEITIPAGTFAAGTHIDAMTRFTHTGGTSLTPRASIVYSATSGNTSACGTSTTAAPGATDTWFDGYSAFDVTDSATENQSNSYRRGNGGTVTYSGTLLSLTVDTTATSYIDICGWFSSGSTETITLLDYNIVAYPAQ